MSLRVLIVDDASFMRTMLKDILVSGGFDLAGEATDGVEAVQKFTELKPDVITMDIVMPLKSGIDAVREIIALNKDARIIMCSALGQESLVLEAINAGAKDYIIKPFDPDRVIEMVKKVAGVK
ncbi:MAG: response regulator [Deltaproteobacteria bacterium]|jgi:two-component system chemotaxis response regulator CheY|nr:response regulator [Candidatus Zymogenaceae bacterium]